MSNTSFILNNNSKVDDSIVVSTDLYSAILPMFNANYSGDAETGEIIITGFTKTVDKGGYIKLPYVSPAGVAQPNATIINGTSAKYYTTSNMYIFKASHIIQDKSYDAEMVVELVPTTNPGDKLYLCFLLKCYRDSIKPLNHIDNVIIKSTVLPSSTVPTVYKHNDFNLQTYIDKNQKKIIYKNNVDTVVIFTNEINIKEYDFSKYNTIPMDLFALYPNDDYKIINPPKVSEGLENIKEGMAGRTAIMTCTPINTGSTPENDQELVITNRGQGTMNQSILTAIVVTFIVIFTCIFAVPRIFVLLLMPTSMNANERMLYTMIFTTMLTILSLVLILDGSKTRNPDSIVAGFVIGLFVFLSAIGISLNKNGLMSIGFNLNNFALGDAMDQMLKKIMKNSMYIVISYILFVVIPITVIAAVGIKDSKKRLKPLRNKSEPFIKKLHDLVIGIGLSYGAIFIIFVSCMITKLD
jgi:hypothetical protein